MRTTRVRTRKREDWHTDPNGPRPVKPKGWVRPEWITVVLPPEAPDSIWNCGTPYVWAVPPEEVAALGFKMPPGRRACVCIHQIEAD